MSESIYIAYGIDPDFKGGWDERVRKAFECRDACEKYVSHEIHGGRVEELELVTEGGDE